VAHWLDLEDDEDSEGLYYSDEMSDSFKGGVNKSSSSHADLTSISHAATEDDISTLTPVSSSSSVEKKHKVASLVLFWTETGRWKNSGS